MISVIIPTYNRANTLYDAAKSVLNQTYTDIELIIVDDGSTDNTEEIVLSLNDSRLRYIKLEKNSGACAARNRGIDDAKGEYIAFQDSDDVWYKDKLEKQLCFLQEKNAEVVFCAINRYGINKNVLTQFPDTNPSDLETKEKMFRDLLKENTVAMVTVLCKRECVLQVRFDESLPRRQDWDWAMRLAKQYRMCYLNKVLVDSYLQSDSISRQGDKHIIALRIIRDKYKDIIDNDKELSIIWETRMASALFYAEMPAAGVFFKVFIRTGKINYLAKAVFCALGLQKLYLVRKGAK